VTSAAGGTAPLQYQYWLYSASGWAMVRDYSTSNSWTWTPSQAGQYAIQVWVRNAGSTANYDAWKGSGYFDITGSALDVTVLAASPALPQPVNTTITWTATASGGAAPLQYQYWLYDGASGAWTMTRDYTTSRTWAWTPTHTGQYAIQVWVRNNGSTARYDAWKGSGYFNII
jgi:N-acetylmuramoyl-L-alanine amidase